MQIESANGYGFLWTSLYFVFASRFLFRAYKSRFFFFGFSRLFLQPPSIRPTSSSLSAISSNCLFEMSLASHATEMINFNVSKRKMHLEIFAVFSSFLEKYAVYDNSNK